MAVKQLIEVQGNSPRCVSESTGSLSVARAYEIDLRAMDPK